MELCYVLCVVIWNLTGVEIVCSKTQIVLDFIMYQLVICNEADMLVMKCSTILQWITASGVKRMCSLGPTQFKWFGIIFDGSYIETNKENKIHETFRLWTTKKQRTYESLSFPVFPWKLLLHDYYFIFLRFYAVICSRLLLNPQKLLSSLDLLRKITRINFSII